MFMRYPRPPRAASEDLAIAKTARFCESCRKVELIVRTVSVNIAVQTIVERRWLLAPKPAGAANDQNKSDKERIKFRSFLGFFDHSERWPRFPVFYSYVT
jgi:hypothetical protein